MNTNLELIVFELMVAYADWSPEAEKKLQRMAKIAESIERTKINIGPISFKTSKFGTHFINCVWAHHPDPDLCSCKSIERKEEMFIDLLKSIGPTECGEEVYNRLLSQIVVSKEEAAEVIDLTRSGPTGGAKVRRIEEDGVIDLTESDEEDNSIDVEPRRGVNVRRRLFSD